MSMMYCESCEGNIDTDFDEMYNEHQCLKCYDKENECYECHRNKNDCTCYKPDEYQHGDL